MILKQFPQDLIKKKKKERGNKNISNLEPKGFESLNRSK